MSQVKPVLMVTNRKECVMWKEESMKTVQANCSRKSIKRTTSGVMRR